MENQITCPHCKKTISNNAIVDSAVIGAGSGSDFFICECGERITYWAISAQLREQKTFGRRFRNWLQTFSKAKS
jgi:hypothetical protein